MDINKKNRKAHSNTNIMLKTTYWVTFKEERRVPNMPIFDCCILSTFS